MSAILRKYGVEATINFPLLDATTYDFIVNAVHASGDTFLMKDEGAEGNTTNGFVDEGTGYSLVLTATEMQAARIVVYVIDQSTKLWKDQCIVIETYGHASAQHAFDLDTDLTAATIRAEIDSNSTQLAAIVADTGELQTDLANGGRLDLILDSLATSAELSATETNLDAILTEVLIDTSELQANQGNWLTATGFSTHSAADVRAEMDSNSTKLAAILEDTGTTLPVTLGTIAGYIDTEIGTIITNIGAVDTVVDAIKVKTDLIPAIPAAVSDIPTANQNAAALLDLANGIETGVTLRQATRGILSASAAKLSGAATPTVTIRDVNDSKDRITATVDADGNRSAVTLDLT